MYIIYVYYQMFNAGSEYRNAAYIILQLFIAHQTRIRIGF